MPSVTFLVAIDSESTDPGYLQLEASDIQDALESKGFDVQSVKPWARPVALQVPTLAQDDTTFQQPIQ